ncbi:MAG: M56 family metallopeptidase, partial [Bacteroidaceae bacterium]|nr:M56 family metallopeptidase [Bacteroidaceae bacterium]
MLALLYGSFALLLSRETFHRFNRLALLGVLVASLILPAVQLSVKKPSYLNYEEVRIPHVEVIASPVQNEVQDIETPQSTLPAIEESMQEPTFRVDMIQVVQYLYIIGLLASLAIFFVQLFRLWREIRGGVQTKDELGNTVVIRGGNFAPYSFLHYIIINASDYEHLRRPILAHEQAHIRLGHTWDLLLLEAVKAVQWFNPFVYLLGRDLKAVHEYEADDAVLNFGIDAKTYQLLLVTKAVGSRLQTVCNNLSHHSLKKRIKMMHKNNSNRWLMSKGLVLPAIMTLAIVAFAKPKVEEVFLSNEVALPAVEDNNQVQDNGPVTVAVPGMGLVMTDEVKGFSGKKMLNAFIPNADAKDFIKKHGPAITVFWLKGTWVVKDDASYIEEHPDCQYPWAFHTKYYDVMLDGKLLDVNNLPNLPASALKKVEMEMKSKEGKLKVNLITKPVQIPA